MSNTRHSTNPEKFKQERFASSEEFSRGLMANLVAKRVALLENTEDRELIWFLQKLSHGYGSLKKVAADLIVQFPHCLVTPSMEKNGVKSNQVYSANVVRLVRREVEGLACPVKGDMIKSFGDVRDLLKDREKELAAANAGASFYPVNYPASFFVEHCRKAAEENLERHLMTLCLDPSVPVVDGSPWYFPKLVSTLKKFMTGLVESQARASVVTSLGQRIHDALDYTAEIRGMTLIEGHARFGKTHAVMDWCARHPGKARYVQLTSTADEISFYRAFAKSLGVSIPSKAKAVDLRMRIEDTLQTSSLILVIDEAHYLWPNLIDTRSLPARINWILTALVNRGVAVALVTTPQFLRNQQAFENKTRWTSEQFTGRISHYEKLPDVLPEDDLEKIARALAGDDDARVIEALVAYASASVRYIASMRPLVDRANYFARKAGRVKFQLTDLKRAVGEVIPSDNAIAEAMQPTEKANGKRDLNGTARPLQTGFTPVEREVQPVDFARSGSNLERVDVLTVH